MNHDHRPSLRLLAMWGLIALLAITTSASARQDWSGRLDEALADESPRSWRGYFALGLQIADAENDAALNTLMNRWPTIDNIKFKQQLIKAMHFDLPTPYRTRLHPRVLAFFEMVLEAEEADVNEWVMNCLPSYAWRTFESEDEAKRWLNEYQDLPSEAVALAKMEDWIDDLALMVKAGDPPGPELNQLVEKGFHWPRHAALQAAAQRKGLPDLILKVLKHESVTEHAAFIIADWLGRIDPQRFPSTEIKNLVADLNKREIPAGKRQTELHVRTIDSDPLKKWILHPPLDVSLPEAGAGLLVVLPGGDGSIDFAPFVQDTIRSAAGPDFVILQMIAPPITPMFKNAMVWPLAHLPDARIPFTMEPVILAAVNVARIEHRIDPNRIWVMGWSSGGPAAYELVLMPDSPFSGALVAMSIFMPNLLSPLNGAKDKSFYVLHSPQDFIAMRFPEAASSQLHEAGARTTLVEYEGGHGWHGDVATKIRAAITWLETPDQARHP